MGFWSTTFSVGLHKGMPIRKITPTIRPVKPASVKTELMRFPCRFGNSGKNRTNPKSKPRLAKSDSWVQADNKAEANPRSSGDWRRAAATQNVSPRIPANPVLTTKNRAFLCRGSRRYFSNTALYPISFYSSFILIFVKGATILGWRNGTFSRTGTLKLWNRSKI